MEPFSTTLNAPSLIIVAVVNIPAQPNHSKPLFPTTTMPECYLLDRIPFEIRQKIFTHALSHPVPLAHPYPPSDSNPTAALLRVNRTIHNETLPIFYDRNTFTAYRNLPTLLARNSQIRDVRIKAECLSYGCAVATLTNRAYSCWHCSNDVRTLRDALARHPRLRAVTLGYGLDFREQHPGWEMRQWWEEEAIQRGGDAAVIAAAAQRRAEQRAESRAAWEGMTVRFVDFGRCELMAPEWEGRVKVVVEHGDLVQELEEDLEVDDEGRMVARPRVRGSGPCSPHPSHSRHWPEILRLKVEGGVVEEEKLRKLSLGVDASMGHSYSWSRL